MFERLHSFSFPTSIIAGVGAAAQLPATLAQFGMKRPLLVTDPGLKQTPVFPKIESIVKNASVPLAVFADVHPNPIEEDVLGGAAEFARGKCDGIIGLGGGSALDVAKAIAVFVAHGAPLSQYEAQFGGYEKITGPIAPIITIPTTAGTGSEVGRSAVITIASLGRKVVIFSPLLMPKRAILDPELTVGLPPLLTAATGMDAFTHHLESLTSPEFHPMCDGIAIKGLELVIQYLEPATKNGADLEARGYMLVAAMMGAVAFQKDLGATHSLAHPLSTVFGTHHGLANAVCLPTVMRFNAEAAEPHYARLSAMFGENIAAIGSAEASRRAAGHVEALNVRLGLPTKLRDCKVPRESLVDLSKKAFLDSCHKTNPRPCTEADLLRLYEECW